MRLMGEVNGFPPFVPVSITGARLPSPLLPGDSGQIKEPGVVMLLSSGGGGEDFNAGKT